MKRFVFLLVVALSLVVWSGAALAQENYNANGEGYFALQVPDPDAMVIDGYDDDWAWFDPGYIYYPEDLEECCQGPWPSKDEFDANLRFAWSGPPENKWYVFWWTFDNVLWIETESCDLGLMGDDLEMSYDSDSDGLGTYKESGCQVIVHHPEAFGSAACFRYMLDPEWLWGVAYVEAGIATEPPDAGHGSRDVIAKYEVRMPLWDVYSPDGEGASTQHVFEAGQRIGFYLGYNEWDAAEGEGGMYRQFRNGLYSANPEKSPDVWLLAVGEYTPGVTAVESKTWGEVKSLMKK